MPKKPPHAYVCYVIYAWVQLKNRLTIKTYIGITNRLQKRLSQHRGIIAGGAKFTTRYTETGADWLLLSLLHGFNDRQDAEKVEWALQNPEKSRHFKHHNPHRKHDLTGIIQNLKRISASKDYSRLWYTLHNIPEQTRQALLNQRNIDLHTLAEPKFHTSDEYFQFICTARRIPQTNVSIAYCAKTEPATKIPNTNKRKYLELAEKSRANQLKLLQRLRDLSTVSVDRSGTN